MVKIFRRDLEHRGYRVQVADALLQDRIRAEQEKKDFGNARGVRNLCDRVIAQHNERIARTDLSALTDEAFVTILDEDIPG